MASWRIEENYLKTLSTAQVRDLAPEVLDTQDLPSPRAARSQVEHAIIESVEATALQGDFMGSMTWLPPQITNLLDKAAVRRTRSEEHTSELQSLMRISYAVFCLKKKKNKNNIYKQ